MRVFRVLVTLLAMNIWGVGVEASQPGDGWRREVGSDGGVYFECGGGACERGAIISCRVFAPNAVTSMRQFEDAVEKEIAALKAAGRVVEPGRSSRSAAGDRVLYETDYVVVGPGKADRQPFRRGFLVGPTETFSVASSSTGAGRSKRNFDIFVARLTARPAAESRAACMP